jgi:phage-related protein
VKDTFGEAFVSVKVGKTTVEELAASVGNLAPTMKAAGLGSDQMLSGIAVLTVQGIKTSEAVTGLKSAISNVIKPTADAQKAAQALGIDFSVTALRTKGLGGFLQELSQKTGGNIQTMAQFFGSVEGLNAVMALTSKDGAKLYLDTMTQMPGAAAEAQKAFDALVAADPSLAWKQLKTELTVLAVEIGQAMLPALKSLADWLKPMLDKLREWVKANPELTATIVKVAAVIGGLMLVVGPLLIALPGLAVAFSVVGTAIAALFSPVGAVVAAIAAAAIAIGVAAYYIYTHWEQVAQTAVGLWEGFKEALVNVWERIKNAIASAVEGVGYIVGRLMGWLVRLMTDPIGALEEAWNYITGLFRGGWEYIVSLWNWGAGVLDSIGQALTTIITAPWQAAIDAVKWLWSLFTGGAAAGASDAMAAGRASGGPVHAGQAYVVGEQGPERFVPSVSGYVYPSVGGIAASASGGYGGDYNGGGNVGSININLGGVVVREEADIDRISSRIAEELQRVLRGREGRQLVGARA